MPATGPVYQPTTVSYETRGGFLDQAHGSPMKILRKPVPQIFLLVCSLFLIAAGIAMIVNGAADFEDTEEHKVELDMKTTDTAESIDIGVIFGGIVMTLMGFVCLGLYVKVAEWRRSCVCPCAALSKKQCLARQLQGQSGGQVLPLNPSTDPLVSHTQYAPVSELPRPEDDECRTLMLSNENKDCLSSAEESDRMLDPDPRIVLRPIGHVEEN